MKLYRGQDDPPTHPVLFDNLLGLTDKNCRDEAQDIMVAGADTTAFTTTTGLMHILQNPKIHQQLVKALQDAKAQYDGVPGLKELEKIDYLVSA